MSESLGRVGDHQASAGMVMGDAAEKQEESAPAVAGQPQEFLTLAEAAELLRVNRKTLTDMIDAESPPWVKRIGRLPRISRTALLKWFETEVAPAKRRRA